MKYWLRTCPHCRRGDILEEDDRHGLYVQCGYILSKTEVGFLFSTAAGASDSIAVTHEKVAA